MCGVVPQSWQGAATRPRAPPSHWRIPASSPNAPSETTAVSSRLGKGLRAPPQDPAQANFRSWTHARGDAVLPSTPWPPFAGGAQPRVSAAPRPALGVAPGNGGRRAVCCSGKGNCDQAIVEQYEGILLKIAKMAIVGRDSLGAAQCEACRRRTPSMALGV